MKSGNSKSVRLLETCAVVPFLLMLTYLVTSAPTMRLSSNLGTASDTRAVWAFYRPVTLFIEQKPGSEYLARYFRLWGIEYNGIRERPAYRVSN